MLLSLSVIVIVLVLFIIYFVWVHTAPLNPIGADVLVVLGYKCDGDQIHPLLLERLETALYLFHRYSLKKIIVTGGAVSSCKTEAKIMMNYLIHHGVDPNCIVLDTEARDTIENLINCRKAMQQYGSRTCLIVSNSFHIRRIQCIAKSIGLSAEYYANRHWQSLIKQVIRTLNEVRAFVITLRILKDMNHLK